MGNSLAIVFQLKDDFGVSDRDPVEVVENGLFYWSSIDPCAELAVQIPHFVSTFVEEYQHMFLAGLPLSENELASSRTPYHHRVLLIKLERCPLIDALGNEDLSFGAGDETGIGSGLHNLERLLLRGEFEGANREGNHNAPAAEILPNLLFHVRQDSGFGGMVFEPDSEFIGDGTVIEAVEVNFGCRFVENAVDSGRLLQGFLYPVRRGSVVDSHVDSLHVEWVRVMVVRNLLPRDDRIWDDQTVVIPGAQVGGAPGDIGDQSFSIVEFDPVVDPKWLLKTDDESGKKFPRIG